MTRVIVLTGGIGTGKSTVAALLAGRGATVIDADAIVHELQAAGSPLLAEIRERFGEAVLDPAGGLDREALAAIVFRDAAARQRLEALVHPRVAAEFARKLAAARERGDALVVLDIPLYFETRRGGGAPGAPGDLVVLAYASEEQQIERTLARDGGSREDVLRRIRAQVPIEEKRANADVVIDNAGSMAETERQVEALYAQLTRAPKAGAPIEKRASSSS